MRRSVANCSVTLLVVISLGLVLVFGQLALPGPVDCRETPYGFEDGGDPDAPDQVRVLTDRMEGLLSASEAGIQEMPDPTGNQTNLGSPSRVDSRAIHTQAGYRGLVFRLWFSIASLVFAL
jgi:hypothetical protein